MLPVRREPSPAIAAPVSPECCPLCGGPNQCGVAAGTAQCWCFAGGVTQAALERLPAASRGKACLCATCAAGGPLRPE